MNNMKLGNKLDGFMIFRLGELFCGPGGLGYAANTTKIDKSMHRIVHAWATDHDRDACNTYIQNVCPDAPKTVLCRDIRKLDLLQLKRISDIDALVFGFPCNDFSIVGEQKGINGAYGPLYSHGVEALKEFQPKWFLAENVNGLKNSNDGKTLQTILDELFNTGYSIYPHEYWFEQYGVPQSRHRIIIVGIREDVDVVFKVPSPKPYENIDVSSRNAIENPPIPPDARNHIFTNQSTTVVERLKYIKPGENAFNADIPEHLRLNVKGAKISQIYRRLDPDKPSYTVTGSGGGGTHVYHWKEPRALTNRERARLQTFPDDFIFSGLKESIRRQIGMAVPVKAGQVLFSAILKCFAGEEYEYITPNITPQIHSSHRDLYQKERQQQKQYEGNEQMKHEVSY